MSNKKNKKYCGKGGNNVFHMSSEEATLAQMPYIDGFVCRGGIHGDTKYNRRAAQKEFRTLLNEDR